MTAGPFQGAMSDYAEATKALMERIVAGAVIETAARVIERTPVDTGFARSAWQVSAGQARPGEVEAADRSGLVALLEIKRNLAEGGFQPVWVIHNNAEYAWALERGHSQQAPQGMVGLTAREFPQIVKQAAIDAVVSLASPGTQGHRP